MAKVNVTHETVDSIGRVLNDKQKPLAQRFRALFALRNIGCDRSVKWITECFDDPSALLKHELAYCLGQAQNPTAIPTLCKILCDERQEPVVRHEAAEALGALGSTDSLNLLESFVKVSNQDIAETCILAAQRLRWMRQQLDGGGDAIAKSPYNSVDPTPASSNTDHKYLASILTDSEKPLWDRYMAMFALRNINTDESIKELAKGLYCDDSALFRHEVAYTLGQAQSPVAVIDLINRLECVEENPMVRHECAEALGSIATDECQEMLKKYLSDPERIVRESCEVALDMVDYEKSGQFQYAATDTIVKNCDNC